MRALIMACLMMLVPALAWAQTPVPESTANEYYKNCMANDDERMTDEGQKALCSCASVKLMSGMTMEEIDGMNTKPGAGRDLYDKMLRTVYGPCMQVPVEDQIYKECMNDRDVKEFRLNNTEGLCLCTAKKSGALLTKDNTPYFDDILTRKPDLRDPYDYMLNSPVFRQHAYNFLYDCLRQNNGDPNGSGFKK